MRPFYQSGLTTSITTFHCQFAYLTSPCQPFRNKPQTSPGLRPFGSGPKRFCPHVPSIPPSSTNSAIDTMLRIGASRMNTPGRKKTRYHHPDRSKSCSLRTETGIASTLQMTVTRTTPTTSRDLMSAEISIRYRTLAMHSKTETNRIGPTSNERIKNIFHQYSRRRMRPEIANHPPPCFTFSANLSQSAMPTSFPISLHPDGIVAFHAPYAIDTPFDVKDTLAVHVEHRDVIAVHRS